LTFTQSVVLAVVQAVTELLPLTSAGHRVLLEPLLGWPPTGPGLFLTLALSILVFCWRDVGDMAAGIIRAAKGKRDTDARLAAQIVMSTLITIAVGVLLQMYVLGALAPSAAVMGWVILGVAAVLFFFDRMSMTVKRIEHATYLDTILIGLGQVIALYPGVGSVAVMVILARMLGYERQAAVRLSLLLSAPVLIAHAIRGFIQAPPQGTQSLQGLLPFVAAFFAALIALGILMAWLRRSSFTPLVIYRLLLGVAVLAVGYQFITL
jgi:undecaprenyl-diphosphatase